MTEYRKISITVPADLLDQVRERVGARGLSAYVTEALGHYERRAALQEFLDWADAERGGPIPPEVMEEVRREWSGEQAEQVAVTTTG